MEKDTNADQEIEKDLLKSNNEDVDKTLKDLKVKDQRPRLTGAARKRLTYLLAKEFSKEKTPGKAKQPIPK